MVTAFDAESAFDSLVEFLRRADAPFVVHEHEPTRTIEEAERNLSFDVGRIVKTVAFRTRGGETVLAALRGTRRVDYPRLAALLGVTRRDISSLSPMEVRQTIGVDPGSVSPLMLADSAILIIDEDVLSISPTLYCGSGRADRTLELAADDLVRLTGARVASFSRNGAGL